MSLQLVCHEIWGGNLSINTPVEMPGLRGHIYSQACDGGRGGDVHSLTTCGSGLLSRMMIADVVGHGESVAAISSMVGRTMKRYMNWPDQRSVLRRLNRELSAVGFKALTTAAVMSYYPPRRWLSLSYAGHPPAWYFRKQENTWQQLNVIESQPEQPLEDLPLAAELETVYTRQSLRVNLGDRLLMVTDGLLEAPDRNDKLFGSAGVTSLLTKMQSAPTDDIAESLLNTVQTHCGNTEMTHDDVTFALVEFVEGPKGSTLRNAIVNRIRRPRGNSAKLLTDNAVPV
ncbi:MAG: serine/threonine-protein phosphatase [Phycisphaerales bacterium]|nr:serine/threonine-protein phosphatase [Phycisphaerales bacterium]